MKLLVYFSAIQFAFFNATSMIAQINQNYVFINYLLQNEKNREALFLLNQPNEIKNTDTLNFLKGYNYYLMKKVDTAAVMLSKVSASSNLFSKAKSFEILNLLYAKKHSIALGKFDDFCMDTAFMYRHVFNTMKAGNYLLLRKYEKFDSLCNTFRYDDFRLTNEQMRLKELSIRARKNYSKSPIKAALLSSVVPGLGKFYAGKKGAAIASFATTTALGLMVVESYYRTKNIKSPQVITFGTLFTFFYAGNILGSYFSVQQQIKSSNGKINNEILASIHVPIIRFFK